MNANRGDEGQNGLGRRKLIPAMVVAFILLFAIIGGTYAYLHWEFTRPGPLPREDTIVIERGASLGSAARLLKEKAAIRSDFLFRMGRKLFGDKAPIQAGEYRLLPQKSMRDILKHLQSGDVILHRLTVAEGVTSAEIVALLKAEGKLNGEIKTIPDEGSLLPETYFFARGDKRTEIIARMQKAMDKALEDAWRGRDGDLPLSTPEEALILASIIEKETAVPAERAHIASVFINRLKRGMRLQSDPTIIYGLTQGRFEQPITVDDLKSETPYNTYKIDGLPPTPITNPGKDAIKAALTPLKTEDLYFVADGTGGHVFAKTLKQHNKNVRAWRRIEAERRQRSNEVGEGRP